MKFAVIAAGEGSRLAAEGISVPKPLIKVGGEPLIDRLIRIFMENDADEIVVICNDHTPLVKEHLVSLLSPLSSLLLKIVVKSTPSSMHSLFEISPYLKGGPFILTTVDTVFREEEFKSYVQAFRRCKADGLFGVTTYIDDESPLYVETSPDMSIKAFLDAPCPPSPLTSHHLSPLSSLLSPLKYISAGIYGLHGNALLTLDRCIQRQESRMRNFQRALLADGLQLQAYPFSKVFDIDHASDIRKAEQFL